MAVNVGDLYAVTRQITGRPTEHRAYVLNRATGTFVSWCDHRHRSTAAAYVCAERQRGRLARAALANTPEGRTADGR
jgi:hypothetical protein